MVASIELEYRTVPYTETITKYVDVINTPITKIRTIPCRFK
jgi:hypothetical protein